MAIRSIITPGDEVLVIEPSFVCYKPIIEVSGGKAIPLPTYQKDDFTLDPEVLKAAITPKTKALVFPYPNNPTGSIMTREQLKEIADIVIDNNLFVISDEIYSELTYIPEGHTTIASIDGMQERTIVINGFQNLIQ